VLFLSGYVGKDLPANMGRIWTQDMGNVFVDDGRPYALDNARFGVWSRGKDWDEAGWWAFVQASNPAGALFVTCPDIVTDARATWEMSRPWFRRIRSLGAKPALVAQDGWDDVAVDWDQFDALFIGGSDEFKLSESAYLATVEAADRGKWTHMGRVNGRSRVMIARSWKVNSVDGTYLAFGPKVNARRMTNFMEEANSMQELFA
jgi:hypothetical protein